MWDFKHTNSGPRYPKSNEFVKRSIQTVKRVLQTSSQTGGDPQSTFLMLQTGPLHYGSPATATKLMRRTLRTLVPKPKTAVTESSLKRWDPKNICTRQVLQPLSEGDNIRIRDTHKRNGWNYWTTQVSSVLRTLLKLNMQIASEVTAVIYYWQGSHLYMVT